MRGKKDSKSSYWGIYEDEKSLIIRKRIINPVIRTFMRKKTEQPYICKVSCE